MNLDSAYQLAHELMSKHNLLIAGWRFQFDRANRRFGCCKYRYKMITLSASLTELNDVEQVKDTILHEIAHALVGPKHGHDWVWRSKALEIGCNGERCYSSAKVNTPRATYEAICKGCGKTHKRFRKQQEGRSSSCGKCSGGRYNPTYKLEFQKV